MKPIFRVAAGAVVLALVNGVTHTANAQTAPPSYPYNADVLLKQAEQQRLTDVENAALIEDYMLKNPTLIQQLTRLQIAPIDPEEILDPKGGPSFKLMGLSTMLSELAGSVQALNDPVQQLALYGTLYSQYTDLYGGLCGVRQAVVPKAVVEPPAGCENLQDPSTLNPPSALQNASLETIETNLTVVGAQAFNLANIVPYSNSDPIYIPTCDGDIGASSFANNVTFGDQTESIGNDIISGGCNPPSKNGILGNFNWTGKQNLTCIKDQGQRGTCHIFAATSALEQLIARDTGNFVNLSEQDFMEREKLVWSPDYYDDGGLSSQDLRDANTNNYQFAYEKQWDYNPAIIGTETAVPPGSNTYVYKNSCANYPSSEPGCSATAPEAPEICGEQLGGLGYSCYLSERSFVGVSPYMSKGSVSATHFTGRGTANSITLGAITSALLENNSVILGFITTPDFQGAPGGYIPYDTSDINAPSPGGHEVHVVAYIANSALANNPATRSAPPGAGGGYLVIKNSWGVCLGDAGYYYMPVSYFESQAMEVIIVSQESH